LRTLPRTEFSNQFVRNAPTVFGPPSAVIPFEASAIAAVSFSAASLRVFAYNVFLFAPVAVYTV
jgi:hypothetical protein